MPDKRRGKRFPLQNYAVVVHKSGFLMPKFKDTVKAKGKVRWVRRVNGRIHVGIILTTPGDLDKTRLRSIESFYTDPHSTQKPKDYLPGEGS